MSEENKALSRRFYDEVFTQGNLAAVDEIVAADCVDHNPPGPGFAPGSEGIKQVVTMFRSAFPDLSVTVEDQIAEGDRVVNRLAAKGTHQGQLMGIPPTGRTVSIGIVDIMRVDGGKVVERWGEADLMGMMQQLGVVSPPGQGA